MISSALNKLEDLTCARMFFDRVLRPIWTILSCGFGVDNTSLRVMPDDQASRNLVRLGTRLHSPLGFSETFNPSAYPLVALMVLFANAHSLHSV